MEWAGSPNISDLFPWIGSVDLICGVLRKKKDHDIIDKELGVASRLVQERIKEREIVENRRRIS